MEQRCLNLRTYRVPNPSKLVLISLMICSCRCVNSVETTVKWLSFSKAFTCFRSRSTILVRLDTNNQDSLRYKPGDHLGIFPGNHEDLVLALIDKLEDAPPVNQIVKVEFLEERNTALGG